MNKLQRIELLKDLIQEAVDKGATSVEQVHQYIADLPFEALERTGLLEDDRFQLREKKRRSIGMVYDAIRGINRQIGQLISDQFENLENSADAARNLADRERDET
jgi:polyhydroxyalkanoate synthesis regulator phasin